MNPSPSETVDFDFPSLPPADRYRLLTNFIVPRPIALVSTRSIDGQNNAAPMSFFNVFSHDPPIVILGIQPRTDGREKDTVANMRRTGEFAVNMVDMAIADQMIVCGANFEAGVDELSVSGLTSIAAGKIDVNLVAESPCTMECVVERFIDFPRRCIVLGEVIAMHVKRQCLDEAGRYVRPEVYQPIARLHADNYLTSDRQFVLKKPDALEGDNILPPGVGL